MNLRPGLLVWSAFLVLSVLLLGIGNGWLYAGLVSAGALVAARAAPLSRGGRAVDRLDLAVVAGLYVGVVALFALAFRVFTQDVVAGLFLSFAAGMLLGVVGPIYYTVWRRGRPLSDLGLGLHDLRATLALGGLLAAVQFALTLWGYDLPAPVDWVPLGFMALTVGLFEAVFFRGFVQNRLEASYGPVLGIGGAASLYAAYHVGFGMGVGEMAFLLGLGLVYAIAFACVRNVFVLWPLLLPTGSFFSQVEEGEIEMPWAAILGFLDVLGLMAAAIWLAVRHERKARAAAVEPVRTPIGAG